MCRAPSTAPSTGGPLIPPFPVLLKDVESVLQGLVVVLWFLHFGGDGFRGRFFLKDREQSLILVSSLRILKSSR